MIKTYVKNNDTKLFQNLNGNMYTPQTIGKNTVVLDRGYNTTCTINLFGLAVTSWRVNNEEQLYLRRKSIFDENAPVTEGINFIFPKYGRWIYGPDNGFVTLCPWIMEESPKMIKNRKVKATFLLTDTPFTRSMWSYSFAIKCEVILSEVKLKFKYSIINNDKEKIAFNFMAEAFLKTPDVRKLEIKYLKDCYLYDLIKNEEKQIDNADKVLKINKATYHVYVNCPDEIMIDNELLNKRVTVRKNSFIDVKIQNGWLDYYSKNPDYDADEYLKLICVGIGNIMNPVILSPGEKFEGKMTLMSEKLDRAKLRLLMEQQELLDFSLVETGHDVNIPDMIP